MPTEYNKKQYEPIANLIAKNFAFANKIQTDSDYGFVYSGKWGGLPAILKLEPLSSGTNEAEKIKIVMAARDSAGPLADYFPKVWKVGHLPMQDGSGFSYIVMEKLDKLPNDLKLELFQALDEKAALDKSAAMAVFTDTAFIENLLKADIIKPLSAKPDQIMFAVKTVAKAIVLAAEDMEQFSSQDLIKRANDYLKKFIEADFAKSFKAYLVNPAGTLDEKIIKETVEVISQMKKMPMWKGDTHLPSAEGTIVHNAIKALEHLSKAGLHWRDVHQDNILYRKSTKTPVFIDFGLYYIE
jgi:hypothetical protein